MKKSLVIALGAVLLVGGSIGVWMSQRSTSNTDTTNNSATTPQSGTTVEIGSFIFTPKVLKVKKGTTVTWTNKDSAVHTVTATDGKNGPHSTNLDPGKTYSFTFNELGTFAYNCVLHPSMTGSVIVE